MCFTAGLAIRPFVRQPATKAEEYWADYVDGDDDAFLNSPAIQSVCV